MKWYDRWIVIDKKNKEVYVLMPGLEAERLIAAGGLRVSLTIYFLYMS